MIKNNLVKISIPENFISNATKSNSTISQYFDLFNSTLNSLVNNLTLFESVENKSPLHFDLKKLHMLNLDEFINKITKALYNESFRSIQGLFLFITSKYLYQLSEIVQTDNEEFLLRKLNSEFNSYIDNEIFWCYRHKILTSNIPVIYDNLVKHKEAYLKDPFRIDRILKVLENENLVENYFINPITFIHFNEYLVLLCGLCGLSGLSAEKSENAKLKIDLSFVQLNLLSAYFKWRNMLTTTKEMKEMKELKENDYYDEIIIYFFKYSIINSLELILNANDSSADPARTNYSTNRLENLIDILMICIFEVDLRSNEVYLFAIISVLIILIKHGIFVSTLNKKLSKVYDDNLENKNVKFLKKVLPFKSQSEEICSSEVILVKLLEFYFIQKYNKSFSEIKQSLRFLNVNDFIINNLFLYEGVYDTLQNCYSQFKSKTYWNFGEILSSVYSYICPKMLKKTILRHVQYQPQDESLIYHLMQYYYINKDFRKSKILIRKILARDANANPIVFDIQAISLMMLVNILINEENFGEALDNAIYNLERIKHRQKTHSELITRNQFLLGFCYSKLGDSATNYEERRKFSHLALSLFQTACTSVSGKSNAGVVFFLARQYYDLKLFSAAESTLNLYFAGNDSGNATGGNYLHYFDALKALIHIAAHQYEAALKLCDAVIKSKPNEILKYNVVVVIKFYLNILKVVEVVRLEDREKSLKAEENLIVKMSEYMRSMFDNVDEEVRRLESISGSISGTITPSVKELIKFSDFINGTNTVVSDKDLKSSMKKFQHEKKNLENLKIEIIKNFYLLVDIIMEHGLDKGKVLDTLLNDYTAKTNIANPNEDTNLLLIDAEKLYKKILESNPVHMIVLKRLSKLLLRKGDLSRAYIYLTKAIKLDEEESELWSMLSLYYMKNLDQAKYYECVLKELAIAKFHSNCFLSNLIPKAII